MTIQNTAANGGQILTDERILATIEVVREHGHFPSLIFPSDAAVIAFGRAIEADLRALVAVPASEPVACSVNEFSSRMCESGTKGCNTHHAAAPAPVSGMPDLSEAMSQIQHKLKVMLASATALDDGDCITGYQIKNGALHHILGVMAGAGYSVTIPLPSAATLGAKDAVEEAAAQMRNEAIPAIVAYRKGIPSPQAPDTPVASSLIRRSHAAEGQWTGAAPLPAAPAPTEPLETIAMEWALNQMEPDDLRDEVRRHRAALAARPAPTEAPKGENNG